MSNKKRLDDDAIRFLCYFEKMSQPERSRILKQFIVLAKTDRLRNIEASVDRLIEERILKIEICDNDLPKECLRAGDDYDSAVNEYCKMH